MAALHMALLFLLAIQPAAAYRLKQMVAKEHDIRPEALAQTDEQRAVWCPSICIPCANGKRSVLVSRERGMGKYVDMLANAGVIVGGIVLSPWALAALPAYAGLKAYTDTLGNECPNIEIIFFDKNESGIYGAAPDVERFAPDRLNSMLSKDEYLQLFQKDLDRVYIAEKAAAEQRDVGAFEQLLNGRMMSGREHHQLPESMRAYAMNSELFCEDFGTEIGNTTEETFGQATGRAVGWQRFANSCKETVAVPTKRCCCKRPQGNSTDLECELMQEEELKKSWNLFKWGAYVCPSGQGYQHYERFGFTTLPESCAESA